MPNPVSLEGHVVGFPHPGDPKTEGFVFSVKAATDGVVHELQVGGPYADEQVLEAIAGMASLVMAARTHNALVKLYYEERGLENARQKIMTQITVHNWRPGQNSGETLGNPGYGRVFSLFVASSGNPWANLGMVFDHGGGMAYMETDSHSVTTPQRLLELLAALVSAYTVGFKVYVTYTPRPNNSPLIDKVSLLP
jgi:hypothetical protein